MGKKRRERREGVGHGYQSTEQQTYGQGNPDSQEDVGTVTNCLCFGSEAPQAAKALPPAVVLAGLSSFVLISG